MLLNIYRIFTQVQIVHQGKKSGIPFIDPTGIFFYLFFIKERIVATILFLTPWVFVHAHNTTSPLSEKNPAFFSSTKNL